MELQVTTVLQLAAVSVFPLQVCRVVLNQTNRAGKTKHASGYLTLGIQGKYFFFFFLSPSEAKLLGSFSTGIEAGPSDFTNRIPSPAQVTGCLCMQKSSSNLGKQLAMERWTFYCVCYFTLRHVPNIFAFLKKLCVPRSILENRVDIKSLKVKSHFEFTRGNWLWKYNFL